MIGIKRKLDLVLTNVDSILFIFTEDDKIKLYLSDDLYWVSKFDKDSKIDDIKNIIKNRAFKLKDFVFEVVSIDKDIEKYNKDFLKFIIATPTK